MKQTWIVDTAHRTGQEVELFGWVDNRRDHGKIIFIDLRDRSGICQVVFGPWSGEALYAAAQELRNEWVVRVSGLVKDRPDNLVNENLPTGKIEIEARDMVVLGKSQTPPFDVSGDGRDINEETRMEFRYLDLRRPRMRDNIILRHKVATLAREYLNRNGFVEIETPTLTKTSPEGARDFLVPSRFYPGKFYALPQAPQQYKQLLMIAGFERYYQLAHAFRDEDLRGDRQFEHTQIDLEMSFVSEKDVRDMVEGMMIHIAESCGKKVTTKPFPVFTHEEALKQFGADKFDIRQNKEDPNELAFAWVVDFPLFEFDEDEKRYTFAHNPFSAPKPEHIDQLMKGERLGELRACQYDLVCNGYEMASGGVRISNPTVQKKVFEIMGLSPQEVDERFGHLIRAYEYGAPPHAGMAPGLDRLVMVLANEPNIREVIAFPVSSKGQTSVMDAPSLANERQLGELGLEIKKKKE
ncbi:MAG: aspartate--tRNA ligase [Candidatus Pacebacteria bacterium]|nr:aspartate--tRNA ligase [Candidatus Paceibacterota bacterium]